jgi:hypothetical protein
LGCPISRNLVTKESLGICSSLLGEGSEINLKKEFKSIVKIYR